MTNTVAAPAKISMTERAAARLGEIAAGDPTRPVLRIIVEGGGCSGFQYKFDLVEAAEADDVIIERDGARIAVDPLSVAYMEGSEIDFVDDLIGAAFRINNPQATAACGCGTSFSI
ncbi:MAG: iron-sulfur cluster insertion protein ErpA [Hyphomicrobiaceae bacterium]